MITQEEKELIRKFCEDNLHTHTDWTGTYVETQYKCDSVDDFVNKLLSYIEDTLEIKEVDLKLENENNEPKITIGTKIRSKTKPIEILSIISDDCHGDEFECSNGSVLSLKQIEKYYEIIK